MLQSMGSQRVGQDLATEQQHNMLMTSKWKNPGPYLLLPSCLLRDDPAVGPRAATSAQPGLLGRWAAALPLCQPPTPPAPFSLPSQSTSGPLLPVPQVNLRFSGAVQTRPQPSLAIVSTAFLSEP